MKIITFTVPCFNSENYMKKCVDSLLKGGEDIEIIIVNDGSKDGTLQIAREYEARYPEVVRVVDKENGGHGSGVNAGLRLARGLYFKVVDSDDWADEQALKTLLGAIRTHYSAGTLPDLYIVNYVYEHVADNTSHVNRYGKQFPVGRRTDWKKVKTFHYAHMLLMHALVYKTNVLKKSGLVLPEHTFYVDDIFSYNPLPYAKSLFYLDIDFYRYFIGRADQSVNLVNMVQRYPQMVRVMEAMTDRWTYAEIKNLTKGLKRYMIHALANYMMTAQLFLCAEDSPERRIAFKDMWLHIKERDKALYRKLRYRTYVLSATLLPWKLRGIYLVRGYKMLCRRMKLG